MTWSAPLTSISYRKPAQLECYVTDVTICGFKCVGVLLMEQRSMFFAMRLAPVAKH